MSEFLLSLNVGHMLFILAFAFATYSFLDLILSKSKEFFLELFESKNKAAIEVEKTRQLELKALIPPEPESVLLAREIHEQEMRIIEAKSESERWLASCYDQRTRVLAESVESNNRAAVAMADYMHRSLHGRDHLTVGSVAGGFNSLMEDHKKTTRYIMKELEESEKKFELHAKKVNVEALSNKLEELKRRRADLEKDELELAFEKMEEENERRSEEQEEFRYTALRRS